MSKKKRRPGRFPAGDAPSARAPKEAPRPDERRGFLRGVWVALGTLAAAEVAWVSSSFLRPRPGGPEAAGGEVFLVGPADGFEPGSVTPVPRGRFYLARLEDGGFLALARECTHLGCTVPWVVEQQRFVCPCHASAFDLRGEVLNPPAPRALDLYVVSIENREVKVDTGRRTRRAAFDPSQPVYV